MEGKQGRKGDAGPPGARGDAGDRGPRGIVGIMMEINLIIVLQIADDIILQSNWLCIAKGVHMLHCFSCS